jgi:predicted O-methyltransferase YrrM
MNRSSGEEMFQRISNRLARTVSAPGNAISLLRCAQDIRSLSLAANPRALADFCFRYPIRPQQVPEELITLFDMVARLQPKNALEIGTCTGGTLFMTCRVADPNATVISVDLPGGRFGRGYLWPRKFIYRKFAKNRQALHLLRKNSHDHETFDLVRSLLGGHCLDFLFIDGDHTYEGVRTDFEMYAPLVRKGGIVAFHDIAKHRDEIGCEVDRFWNEIRQEYRHVEIVKDPNQRWAGIGVLYV